MSEQGVLDALPDGVVVADADGRVVRLNRGRPHDARRAGETGRPLAEVLLLQDQDGNDWCTHNAPYDGLRTRTGVPEQSWLLPDGTEVLVTARIHRPAPADPVEQVAVSCAPAAAGPGSTASAPTWSPPSPTSCARR